MNLTYYVRIVIRRGWIMLLAMIITAGAAYGFSKAQTPVYRASQRVLFQPARNDFGLTETLRTVLRSYVVYLNTDTQAAAAIDRLNLDMQPGELLSHTTINSDPTQLIVQIDVDMEDGKMAADIAHEMGLLLFEYKTQQNSGLRREDRIDPVMIDRAGWSLHSPNTRINTLAGAVLGLMLGGVIVFALEYLESNIVRSKDDVERFLDLPVLAAIPADDTRA
jgi:capsular polysaccharide biosynthesis protein